MASTLFLLRRPPTMVHPALLNHCAMEAGLVILLKEMRFFHGDELDVKTLFRLILDTHKIIII
ncbi:MAG: hypothetical protein NNA18_07300 [Nitrospira sp.]|nr:hypothetical protein [Nitrospira sp.]